VLDDAVPVDDGHLLGLADPAVEDTADDEPADVVVPVEHGPAELETGVGLEARCRNG
jgi:hypothetical protein